MEYRWDQEQKGFPEQKFEVGMDSNDLINYFEERIENTTFKERTQYYFENAGLMANKAKRYRNIEKGGNGVEDYALQHTNHSADKRKKSARKAADAFGKAAVLADKYQKKPCKDYYEMYTRREEIMRLRMEGMVQAAETKSTSEDNEIYLKSKAKISCLMILYDQLKYLKKEAKYKEELKSVQKLEKKEKALRKELTKVQNEMKENLPTTDQKWKHKNGIYELAAAEELSYYRRKSGVNDMNENTLNTMKSYKQIREHCKKYKMDPPCYIVRLDKKGNPITLVDSKKLEWNKQYQTALRENNQDIIIKMDMEAIKRIEQYDLPSFNTLYNHGSNAVFRQHPAQYYEMIMSAPEFVSKQMEKGGAVKEYIEKNPVLQKKIEALNILKKTFEDVLGQYFIDSDSGKFSPYATSYHQDMMHRHGTKILESYRALNEAIGMEKEKEAPKLQTADEKAEEFEELKKTNPNLTKDGYKIYKALIDMNQIYKDPEYLRITEEFGAKYDKAHGEHHTWEITRIFGAMLRAVHYDQNGNPISETDKSRKKQNDEWMNSWVEKENETEKEKEEREKTRNKIVKKEVKTLFKGFDFPEPENLEEWLHGMLKKKPFSFMEMLKRAIAFDMMAKIHPGLKDYLDKHKAFVQKINVATALMQMLPQFSKAYYGIDCAAHEGAQVIDADLQADVSADYHDPESLTGYEQQHLDAYRMEYNKLIPLLQQEKMEEAEAEENALNEMKRKKEEYLKKSKLFCPLIQLRVDTVLFYQLIMRTGFLDTVFC